MRLRLPAKCISATFVRQSTIGSTHVIRGASSCCASRTRILSVRPPRQSKRFWSAWSGWGLITMKKPFTRPKTSRATWRRWRSCSPAATRTSASAFRATARRARSSCSGCPRRARLSLTISSKGTWPRKLRTSRISPSCAATARPSSISPTWSTTSIRALRTSSAAMTTSRTPSSTSASSRRSARKFRSTPISR